MIFEYIRARGLLSILIFNLFYLNFISSNLTTTSESSSTKSIPKSISVSLSKEKIKIKLVNGQILIGNRKIITIINENSKNKTNRIVYEFLGIPFAQAPINERRFQFPHKLENLLTSDVYDATYSRSSCMQEYDNTFPGFKGSEMWNPPNSTSEDCLFFNIWVPVTHEQDNLLYRKYENDIGYEENAFRLNDKLKTTLFWIYGGSYNSGSANLKINDGTVISSFEHVIIVTANYRVGPFGFLFLNSSSVPGNAGLADQLQAIEWYKKHYLDFFGGSRNHVCLFGESAGSMSLHYLLLSDKNHLFNRVIFQSSSAYLELSFRNRNDALKVSLSYAEKIGCLPGKSYVEDHLNDIFVKKQPLKIKNNLVSVSLAEPENAEKEEIKFNTDEVFKCLLRQNASYLSVKQFEVDYVNEYLKMQFVPTKDLNHLVKYDPNEFNFANHSSRFNHDIFVGVNQNEGSYFTFYLYNDKYFNLKKKDSFVDLDVKYDNKFVEQRLIESLKTKHPSSSKSHKNKLSNKVENEINNFFYEKYVNCLSDLYTVNNNGIFLNDFNNQTVDFDLNSNENKKINSPDLAWRKFSKIIGDITFSCPSIKLANKYSELNKNNTYFYKFNKRSNKNPWPKWMGTMHGYEIEYVFGLPWMDFNHFDHEDRMISLKMMSYWANFAKTGKLYSIYDKKPRKNFVEFSPYADSMNLTEESEYEQFNRLFTNCEYFNQLSKKQSFASKYELCLKYRGIHPINSSNISRKNIRNNFIEYFFAIVLSLSFVFVVAANFNLIN